MSVDNWLKLVVIDSISVKDKAAPTGFTPNTPVPTRGPVGHINPDSPSKPGRMAVIVR